MTMETVRTDEYHGFSKLIHWMTALIILGLLPLGFYMTLMDFSETKLTLYGLHKSFGLLVLVLAFVRVFSWVIVRKPAHLDSHALWERIAAKIAHFILYLSLFLMPVSGWVMSSAGDFPIAFFGIPVPHVMEKSEEIFKLSRQVHEFSSYTLIAVIGMHVLGALKHHFVDRDTTLRRMIRMSAHIGEVLCIVVLFGVLYMGTLALGGQYVQKHYASYFTSSQETVLIGTDGHERVQKADATVLMGVTDVQGWQIVAEESSIGFTATQYGQEFSGGFPDFRGDIYFDAQKLEQSRVNIVIDIASIKTGSGDRDGQAVSAEWFDAKTYPQAIYTAETFEKTGDSAYLAKGYLELRGTRLPVDLPFDLQITEDDDGNKTASMSANLMLNRLEFGVGQGTWASTDAIGGDIKVEIKLLATAR